MGGEEVLLEYVNFCVARASEARTMSEQYRGATSQGFFERFRTKHKYCFNTDNSVAGLDLG